MRYNPTLDQIEIQPAGDFNVMYSTDDKACGSAVGGSGSSSSSSGGSSSAGGSSSTVVAPAVNKKLTHPVAFWCSKNPVDALTLSLKSSLHKLWRMKKLQDDSNQSPKLLKSFVLKVQNIF
jgi:hypothetical protein